MTAADRGIVLDAETAAVVPDGATLDFDGDPFWTQAPDFTADPGDLLTHIGGRPVAELVAEADQAEADAKALRAVTAASEDVFLLAIADRIDERRAKAIDPALVTAAHQQWAEVVERG